MVRVRKETSTSHKRQVETLSASAFSNDQVQALQSNHGESLNSPALVATWPTNKSRQQSSCASLTETSPAAVPAIHPGQHEEQEQYHSKSSPSILWRSASLLPRHAWPSAAVREGDPSTNNAGKHLVQSTLLLDDDVPLCSACEIPTTLKLGECGHLLCGDCTNNGEHCGICDITDSTGDKGVDMISKSIGREDSNQSSPLLPRLDWSRGSPVQVDMSRSHLCKVMIDITGALVLKPEFEHENVYYKSAITPGSIYGPEIYFDDTVQILVESAFLRLVKVGNTLAMRMKLKCGRMAVMILTWHHTTLAPLKTGCGNAFTQTVSWFMSMCELPNQALTRLDLESQIIKHEVELAKLQLKQMQLRLKKARLGASKSVISIGLELGCIMFLMLLASAAARLFNRVVLDMSFNAYESG